MFGIGTKEKTIAIVDVGSASAAVSIIHLSTSGPSTIVAADRAFIPHEKRTKDQSAIAMSVVIVEAAKKCLASQSMRNKESAQPTELYTYLRTPWTTSKTIQVSEKFEREEKIRDSVIKDMSKKVSNYETGSPTESLLEAMLLRIELNGYATSKPVGKSAHEIRVSALMTTTETAIRKIVQEGVEKAFPVHTSEWRSHTRALLTLIREQHEHVGDCIVIDLAMEGSSIMTVQDGLLGEQLSTDEGVHSILNRIAPKSLPEESLALVRMLERDQCSSDTCESLRESMSRSEQDLVRIFGELFAKYAITRRIPNTMLLIVHPDLAEWLSRFFSRIDFSQFTMTAQPFQVSVLTPKDLDMWVKCAPGVSEDTSMMLDTALVHIEHNALR